MKYILGFLITLTASFNCYADDGKDMYLDINVGSLYTRDTYCYNSECKKYNEDTGGIGITKELNQILEVKAGIYYNAYRKQSVYALLNLKQDYMFHNLTVSPGLAIGAVTGYNDTEIDASKFMPVIVSNVTLRVDNYRINIGYIPNKYTSTLIFQLEMKI